MQNWIASRKNNNKRVDMYSNPGVMEVIYKNEWRMKPNRNEYVEDDGHLLPLLILIAVGILGFLLTR